jgi:hypothetical protein
MTETTEQVAAKVFPFEKLGRHSTYSSWKFQLVLCQILDGQEEIA